MSYESLIYWVRAPNLDFEPMNQVINFHSIFWFLVTTDISSIDCFKCGSFNGSDPGCEDPFHHNISTAYLESPCMSGWRNRDGLFPASQCIKLSGYFCKQKISIF